MRLDRLWAWWRIPNALLVRVASALKLLNDAIDCGHLRTNPARSVRRNPHPRPTCSLSREEIRRLHCALER